MLTLEIIVDVQEDGTLRTRQRTSLAKGPRRVVIVIDDAEVEQKSSRPRLPDLSEFRASLDGRPYPGNSVVDMRAEER
jgi:hypothetical protein